VKPAGFETTPCDLNALVDCPGGTAQCMGNQCCPDNTLCPSADDGVENKCLKPKAHDCTGKPEGAPSTESVGIAGLQQKAQPRAAQGVLAGTGVSTPQTALLAAAIVAAAGVASIYRSRGGRRGAAGYGGIGRELVSHEVNEQGINEAC